MPAVSSNALSYREPTGVELSLGSRQTPFQISVSKDLYNIDDIALRELRYLRTCGKGFPSYHVRSQKQVMAPGPKRQMESGTGPNEAREREDGLESRDCKLQKVKRNQGKSHFRGAESRKPV